MQTLLSTLEPALQSGEFVFCTVSDEAYAELDIQPIGWFREQEGITLIVEKTMAQDAGLDYTFVSRMITLGVHSSLEAVGLLAAVTAKLAAAGISVNPVSAYYHDHLFVPTEKTAAALDTLQQLTHDATSHIR